VGRIRQLNHFSGLLEKSAETAKETSEGIENNIDFPMQTAIVTGPVAARPGVHEIVAHEVPELSAIGDALGITPRVIVV
jgi:hypothetical protein